MRRNLLTTAALFAALMFGASAMAGNNTFTPQTGDWNDDGNWSGGIPDDTDNVIIGNNKTCTLSGTAGLADSLDISGTLNITGVSLTVDGDSDYQHNVAGTINLTNSTASLLFCKNDHELSGGGAIDGADYSAQIQIGANESGRTLTSSTNITGALQIIPGASSSSTTFTNNGVVEADEAGDMLAVSSDTLSGSGQWKVTGSGSTLQFQVGSTSLTGSFTVSDGTLDINATVETTSTLSFTGGEINVAADTHFTANKS
jgi:hypothetical protein